jgi:hypothetical protein
MEVDLPSLAYMFTEYGNEENTENTITKITKIDKNNCFSPKNCVDGNVVLSIFLHPQVFQADTSR